MRELREDGGHWETSAQVAAKRIHSLAVDREIFFLVSGGGIFCIHSVYF